MVIDCSRADPVFAEHLTVDCTRTGRLYQEFRATMR
jgi:hypothetical protein